MRGINKLRVVITAAVIAGASAGCASKPTELQRHERRLAEDWLKWAERDTKALSDREDEARASLERSALEAEQAAETVAEEPEDEPQP